jgi:hypothetical protein
MDAAPGSTRHAFDGGDDVTRPLRYSINVPLDGCVDHAAFEPDEAVHRHAMEFIAGADALLFGRATYELLEAGWRGPEAAAGLPPWMTPTALAELGLIDEYQFVVQDPHSSLASPGHSNSSSWTGSR